MSRAVTTLVLAATFACSTTSEGTPPATSDRAVTTLPGPGTATVVTTFDPVGPDGKIEATFRVTETLAGAACPFTSSEINGGYSCLSEATSTIFDPCWLEHDGSVVCLADPWSTEATRLLRPTDLPPLDPPSEDLSPWAVEIASGARCVLSGSGAHSNFGGDDENDVVDYYCDHDVALFRGLDLTGPVWSARQVELSDGQFQRLLGSTPILRAWVG